ncbi:wdr55 [Symbiodinium sp. KB8]|nr:wdr55 [Symbiodinium sp. KB8]
MERLALSGAQEARRLLAGETWAEIFGEEAAGIPAGEAENEEVDSSDEEERPTKRQKLKDKRKKKKAAPGGLGNQKQQQAARFFSGL